MSNPIMKRVTQPQADLQEEFQKPQYEAEYPAHAPSTPFGVVQVGNTGVTTDAIRKHANDLISQGTAILKILGCVALAFLVPSCVSLEEGSVAYDANKQTWNVKAGVRVKPKTPATPALGKEVVPAPEVDPDFLSQFQPPTE